MNRNESQTPTLSRFRPRFGLLALLSLIGVVAIGSAWYGERVRYRQRTVTIAFVDDTTGRPATNVTYEYTVTTKEGTYKESSGKLESSNGKLDIDAPRSCEIWIYATSPDYLGGYSHSSNSFVITSDDKLRQLTFKMIPGITIKGTIVDAKTNLPVADAAVSPVVFLPPLFVGDDQRSVKSDANGNFELSGVEQDLGFNITHSDFLETMESVGSAPTKDSEGRILVSIKLEKGDVLTGVVSDPSGQSIAKVSVGDGAGKHVKTKADGSFVLNSPRKWADPYYLSFEKPGFVTLSKYNVLANGKPLTIVLEPLYEISGNVTSGAGPVKTFDVIAGPGRNPPQFECQQDHVSNNEGRFRLKLEEAGIHWVSVRADGFAIWEGTFELKRNVPPINIELATGVQVCGKVQLPQRSQPTDEPIEVTLTPQRPDAETIVVCDTPSREFAKRTWQVANDGTFHLSNVRPDKYTLRISGSGLTPFESQIDITDTDTDVGTYPLQGVGGVIGQINRPANEGGGPWRFASGEVTHDLMTEPLIFNADEHGKFILNNLPVGKNEISFAYNISADIIDAHSKTVTVAENGTTKITFFGE